MKTEEELKKEQEASKDENKDQDKQVLSQLQLQVEQLTKLVGADKTEAARKITQTKADEANAAAVKLKAEADIKNLLTKQKGDDTNYDDLSPKEMLDIVAEAFDTAIDARTQLATAEVSKPIEELNKKLDAVQKYLLNREAASGIEKAREKFSDFDDYKEEISAVFTKYPGIAVKDAYLLAKSTKAAGSPSQEEVETEKPVNLATRADNAQEKFDKAQDKEREDSTNKDSGGSPRRSFRSGLAAAAEKILSSRKQ